MDRTDPSGLVAYLLSLNLLVLLRQKDLSSTAELTELVEQSLLNLETDQASAPAEDQALYLAAREHLERMRQRVSR